jgi:hypothetical protein
MPFAICLGGPESKEKDAWLRELIDELSSLGLKTGVIRPRSEQPEPSPAALVRLDDRGISVERNDGGPRDLEQILGRYLSGLDLVFSLAHPAEKRPKIEFCAPGAPPKMLDDPGLRALVSEDNLEAPKPVFSPGDVAGLAGFIAREIMPKREPAVVRILLDGRRIPIKGFVQDILARSIRGMISSLKGGDRPGRLEVFID